MSARLAPGSSACVPSASRNGFKSQRGKIFALLTVTFAGLACVGAGACLAATSTTTIDPVLLADASSHPATMERVIISSDKAVAGATDAFNKVSANSDGYGAGTLRKQLSLVGGIAATLPASRMAALAKLTGLTVSPDAQLRADAFDKYSNIQLWPYLSGIAHLWTYQWNPAPPTPTIAVVDSGVNASVPDMAGRLLIPQLNFCSLAPNSPGDGDGHGTFVSSILAGAGTNHVGAAPNGKIISLDVINDQGMATTSDVIAAAQWIVDNRNAYNIKVVNFSLHSTVPSHFVNDPLDKAVEKLWLSGVVVVTAAGNYGVNGHATAVRYAPGNDPFVITVGALDNKGTLDRADDVAAPWSTWGYTLDGFAKPDIGASGRYMIGAVPSGAALLSERPANIFSAGYMQLSGTSFSAPVVAGAAAQLLALHPELTPDQVKGALMLGSEQTPAATPGSLGVGEVDAGKAASLLGGTLPNPNAALENYLATNWTVSPIPYFDGTKWAKDIAANPASWDAASWEAKYWSSASQETKYWSSVAWETKYWSSASTIDSAWQAQSQVDSSTETVAEGDATSSPSLLAASDFAALFNNPFLTPSP